MSGDDLPQLDTRHAHPARVYNYWLGGMDNFAADREAAEQAIAANPGIKTDVRANRAWLRPGPGCGRLSAWGQPRSRRADR
jgi:S-adenosyl methyltransferase